MKNITHKCKYQDQKAVCTQNKDTYALSFYRSKAILDGSKLFCNCPKCFGLDQNFLDTV